MSSKVLLNSCLDKLPEKINTLYLAYSGGIDSSVLLHVLLSYRHQYKIVIWHVNHGLQKNAQEMEEFSRIQTNQSGFEFRVNRLNMDPAESNMEARARELRYHLFEQVLTEQDVLLTAHHKNDQAETLLLNLMRGSGSAGLRAIASIKALGRGLLVRPLINFSRLEIEQYALDHKLVWVDDPSNNKTEYDRNYLRHNVLPAIINRWPSAISQMQRASELQNESEQLHTDLARIDFDHIHVSKLHTEYSCLSVKQLTALSLARQKNIIRYWIKLHQFSVLGFHKIEELLNQLNSRIDAMPVIEGDCFQVRLFKNTLYLVKKVEQVELRECYTVPQAAELIIPQISFSQSRQDLFEYMKKKDNGENLTLRFRQPNQQGKAQAHSHTLKRLFQKHQIPPWKRSLIPQLFLNEQLCGLWIN